MNAETTRLERTSSGQSMLLAVGALGASCVATQLVLMREMLCVFAGNELVLGIVLGNWLLLMGGGAWLGRWSGRVKDRLKLFVCLHTLVGILPVGLLLVLRALPTVLFTRGAAVGLEATVFTSLLVLLPYCLTAGFLLTWACAVVTELGGQPGQVYVADSVGSIVGGAAVSVLLFWMMNPFILLVAVGSICLATGSCLAWRCRFIWILLLLLLAGAFLIWCSIRSGDLNSRELQYASETILFQGSSPYGELIVTAANRQTNVIQNGLPVLSTHNTEQVEEAAHYAMAQRPDARRVLLIGGSVAGTTRELLKYRAQVTCVELDPLFLELGRKFLPENLANPRITVVNTDGRRFVQTTPEQFDVTILDLPDPSTAQLNRFHTAEFLGEAKRILTTNGVLALAVGRYENYVSPELARLLATAQRTLRSVFSNVVMLPVGRVFFLASDGELGANIAERLERADIGARFVNRHYLDGMLTPDRLAALDRAVTVDAPLNRDDNPVLYFQHLRHWASQFNGRAGVVEMMLGLALLAYVVRLRGAPAAVFAGGFAASSLEVVLLLGFQTLCGSLYYQLAVIVTVFMAGLAAGAAWGNRFTGHFKMQTVAQTSKSAVLQVAQPADLASLPHPPTWKSALHPVWESAARSSNPRASLVTLALGLALFALLLPFALKVLGAGLLFRGSALVVQIVIALLTLILAVLVGAEFPLANRVESGATPGTVSRVYTADFLGACLGALLASALLIPLLGVTMMCWLAAGLNLLGAAAVLMARPGRT